MLDDDCLCHGNMGIVDIYLTRGYLDEGVELLNNIVKEKKFIRDIKF